MRFFGLMIFSCTLFFFFFFNTNPYEYTLGKNPDRTTQPIATITSHNPPGYFQPKIRSQPATAATIAHE